MGFAYISILFELFINLKQFVRFHTFAALQMLP